MIISRHCQSLRIARVVAAAAFAFAAAGTSAQEAKVPALTELKLSVAVGPAYALGTAGERWAKRLAEKSGGTLTARMFPGATLAQRDPAREFRALADGAADLAVGSTLFWAAQVKELGVVGLPWLAALPKQQDALVAGPVGDALRAAVESAGAVALAIAPLGHRQLATRERMVRGPGDVAGLRVRIPAAQSLIDIYVALGALPQAMAYAHAQAAFLAGTLDAEDAMPTTFATTQIHALGVKRVVLWNAVGELAIFAVNRKRWESWTEGEREAVRASAQEIALELAALVPRENEVALATLKKRGMTVTSLTAAERTAFAQASRSAYDKAAAYVGEALVRAAEAAVSAAGQQVN